MISAKKIGRAALCSVLVLLAGKIAIAQNLATKSGKVTIFSEAPVEDIKASTEKATAVFIPKTGEIAFLVPIKSLTFNKGLMQEHFNENYMESDKFPYAKFKGTVNPDPDLNKDGEYVVTASGVLSVHGVDKQRTISGKLIVKNGQTRVLSSFDVACVDHRVKVPTLLMTKVAEVISVNVDALLTPLPHQTAIK